MRSLKASGRILGLVIPGLLLLACVPYFRTEIYTFPPPTPFAGPHIHNPYAQLPPIGHKANFHAHTEAWGGITNGHGPEAAIAAKYAERGYTIACVSNYHRLGDPAQAAPLPYIPVYEHGYNVLKSHCLAISPDSVSFFDFPLMQGASQQQYVIEHLRALHAVVALAHPAFGGGRSTTDMKDLVGYHYTEVLSAYANSTSLYDEALSAGRLSWVMGNDDVHDIEHDHAFRFLNVIHARTAHPDSIMAAYGKGWNYAVQRTDGTSDKFLLGCEALAGDSFVVRFSAPFDSIRVIGQGGVLRHHATATDSLRFGFAPDDNYLRVEAGDPELLLLLNPLVRYDGRNLPLAASLTAVPNSPLTWAYRAGVLLFGLLNTLFIRTLFRKR